MTLFSSLSSARLISLDVETHDPHLKDLGPGAVRKDGHLAGVSVATDDGFAAYYPVGHEAGGNLDKAQVLAWLRAELAGPQDKTGANLLYDLEWLAVEGVKVGGRKLDVQTVDALLDENQAEYSLEAVAQRRVGEGKLEEGLMAAALARGLVRPGDKKPEQTLKENLWRLHGDEVREYGVADAALPIRILKAQLPLIEEQGLARVLDLEARLVDPLLEMRLRGVRVDLEVAERNAAQLDRLKRIQQDALLAMAGWAVDYWSNQDLARVCEKLGLPHLRTPKGNPSFESDWLDEQAHPLFETVARCRRLDRAGSVYIKSKIITASSNGRVHPIFQPVRRDDGGTRSGRLSSAQPNLQQVPAHDKELSPLIRGCFLPEPGEEWGCLDWSQVEPRITVHYAYVMGLAGGATARERYLSDPTTDYHQLTADMAGIERKPAKTLNLGLSYGMGKKKLAHQLGLTYEAACELFIKYHRALPFIKQLNERCQAAVERRGYIKTLLGRRRRFELFGPRNYTEDTPLLQFEEAVKRYGTGVIRYFVHKAMNAAVQGTAADAMKLLLVRLYEARLTPLLTVHDDISNSFKTRRDVAYTVNIMELTVREELHLEVPLKTDIELGPSWGQLKEVGKDELTPA